MIFFNIGNQKFFASEIFEEGRAETADTCPLLATIYFVRITVVRRLLLIYIRFFARLISF